MTAEVAAPNKGLHQALESHAEPSTSSANHWHTSPPEVQGQEQAEDDALIDEMTDVICGGCGLLINEDSAQGGVIHFATQLWHLECFRCAKCSEQVSTDRDDILLLSDGHPICASCNYSCQICGLPILEEAIMTGDESYHATCFTCRTCKSPIKELVFAKTSQGIYCMPCHSDRVARSRRHTEARKKSGRHRDGSSRKHKPTAEGSQLSEKVPPVGEAKNEVPAPEANTTPFAPSTSTNSTLEGMSTTSSSVPQVSDQQVRSPSPAGREGSNTLPPDSMTPAKIPQIAPEAASTPLLNRSPPMQSLPQPTSPFTPSPGQKTTRRPGSSSNTSGPTLRELRSGAGSRQAVLSDVASRSPQSSTVERSKNVESPLPKIPSDAVSEQIEAISTPERVDSSSRGLELQGPHPRRSSETDARDAIAALKGIRTSESAPTHASISDRQGSGLSSDLDHAAPPNQSVMEGRTTPLPANRDAPASKVATKESKGPLLGSPLPTASPPNTVRELRIPPHTPPTTLAQASRFSSSSDDDFAGPQTSSQIQVKRASRLSFMELPSQTSATSRQLGDSLGGEQLTEAFSFYDADLVKLMDTIEDVEVASAPSQMSSPVLGENFLGSGDPDCSPERHETISNSDRENESPIRRTAMVKSQSGSSITTIQAKVRQSMSQAQDGQVSMDTNVIEMVLQELDDTRTRMKSLHSKYDRLKRASQYAVQGIGHARLEYDVQKQARSDAEVEMLRLKERLADQASKLAALAHQEKRHERLEMRSKNTKDSLQDMTKNLAKLTVERDLAAAEVAELIAVQEGRTPLPSAVEGSTKESFDNSLQRGLSVRLDSVKAKYREEIELLTDQRNELLIEIEDLRQSRDVYLEETETLNTRNEELNSLLSKLSAKVESLSTAASNSSTGSRQTPRSGAVGWHGSTSGASNKNSAFGFGFSSKGARGHAASPSIASSKDGFPGGSSVSQQSTIDLEPTPASAPPRGGINLGPQAAAHARAEAAALASFASSSTPSLPLTALNNVQGGASAHHKKFKWMKPISSKTHASSSYPGVLGQSPPIPPPKSGASGQATGSSSSSFQPSFTSSQREREMSSHELIVREHVFTPFSVLRPTRCFACQKNMWGQSEVRCASCGQVCHSKCLSSLPISCNQPYLGRVDEGGTDPVGPSMFGRPLAEQAAAEGREVPLIVEKCIHAVEKNGMDYEGIYRKSGGTSQLRVITQLFERGIHFDLDDVERFNDISAVTSVLKNYFRELPEPLMTFNLHEEFVRCIEQFKKAGHTASEGSSSAGENSSKGTTTDKAEMGEAKLQRMRDLTRQLPRPHFETLKLLIGHLNQVAGRSEENRMTARNLGVVFGPTLMRSPDASKEFSEMGGKSLTIEYLCERFHDVFA